MAKKKRVLSKLQKAYQDFFFDMLDKYEVTSPAKLDDEGKKNFFNDIRVDWKKAKRKLQKESRFDTNDIEPTKLEKISIAKGVIAVRENISRMIKSEIRNKKRLNESFDIITTQLGSDTDAVGAYATDSKELEVKKFDTKEEAIKYFKQVCKKYDCKPQWGYKSKKGIQISRNF